MFNKNIKFLNINLRDLSISSIEVKIKKYKENKNGIIHRIKINDIYLMN